jgi:hypothetical protein
MGKVIHIKSLVNFGFGFMSDEYDNKPKQQLLIIWFGVYLLFIHWK